VYVCICNGVTDHQIREAAANGVRTVAELTMRTGCGASCGSCIDTAIALLDGVHERESERQSVLPILSMSHAA
jgi:bacterioferritin-associated ferredoxin